MPHDVCAVCTPLFTLNSTGTGIILKHGSPLKIIRIKAKNLYAVPVIGTGSCFRNQF